MLKRASACWAPVAGSPAPDLLEREREIHADGGLPHAAFAAAHRDDVRDSWQLFRTGGRLGQRA